MLTGSGGFAPIAGGVSRPMGRYIVPDREGDRDPCQVVEVALRRTAVLSPTEDGGGDDVRATKIVTGL